MAKRKKKAKRKVKRKVKKKVKRPKRRVVRKKVRTAKKRRVVRKKVRPRSKIRPVKRGANMGTVFLGLLFLLVSLYLFITQTSTAALIFGGGVMALLGIITLIRAFRK